MADIFTQKDAQILLKGKSVWLFGDSNMRSIYKDIVWLLKNNTLISCKALKSKLETSFQGDFLLRENGLHRGRNFEEERRYISEDKTMAIDFMFLTKCLTARLRSKFEAITCEEECPDLIVINSCLWDICRWGPDGVKLYKENIVTLMKLMKKHLLPSTLVIWTTTPPVSTELRGGLVVKQIKFLELAARFEVMEGNLFVRQEVISHGFDVLDFHFHLLLQIHRRNSDGIHWISETVRHMTNLVLTHASLSWGVALPGNFNSPALARVIACSEQEKADESQIVVASLDSKLDKNRNELVSRAKPTVLRERKPYSAENNWKTSAQRGNNYWSPYGNHQQIPSPSLCTSNFDLLQEQRQSLCTSNLNLLQAQGQYIMNQTNWQYYQSLAALASQTLQVPASANWLLQFPNAGNNYSNYTFNQQRY